MPESRVIFALAAEADDDFIWNRLADIQTTMFAAGPIAIKFGYFGEEGPLAIRPFVATRWATDPDDMQALLDHARSRCVCGCFVDIDSILAEAVKESKQEPVRAVIIIADHFRGDHDEALAHARQLRAAGTRLFIFQQGSAHNGVFKTLAETTGGAHFTYNPAVERIAERLPRLLEAVSHYAIGGTDALDALANQSAGLLLEQIDRSQARLKRADADSDDTHDR